MKKNPDKFPQPTKLEAVYKEGKGWEIVAEFSEQFTPTTVLQSEALVSIGYAPYLSPFTKNDFRNFIGETLTQMAEAWNKEHAPQTNKYLKTCENCGNVINTLEEFRNMHKNGCDYVWGRRGWRQLGVYDG